MSPEYIEYITFAKVIISDISSGIFKSNESTFLFEKIWIGWFSFNVELLNLFDVSVLFN